jgi:hypothetical protein
MQIQSLLFQKMTPVRPDINHLNFGHLMEQICHRGGQKRCHPAFKNFN